MASPENNLWKAVLARCFEDACAARAPATKNGSGTRQDERAEAREWLLSDGVDMQTVCFLADVPPETVLKAAETLAHMHWRWRRVGEPVSLREKAAAPVYKERRVTRDYGYVF